MSTTVIDAQARPITLGRQLFSGQEGRVLEIPGSPRQVAKLYHPGSKGVEPGKLAALMAASDKDLLEVAAWPVTTLHRGSPSSPALGFVMPKFERRKELHEIYGVDSRLKYYPDADWLTLVTAAINCADIMNRIHQRGIVVGDVNQKNLLVAADGSVRIVDCDSFQVRTPQGRVYRCGVGVPEFTPPELQALPSYGSVDRTPNHDCFGLSVMIFYLLFGRHPYAGRGASGGSHGNAIRENRFAYTRNQGTRRAMPPPGALTLDVVPFSLAVLFERAFAPPAKGQQRPSAAEWHYALTAFRAELVPCPKIATHLFHPIARRCPWCKLKADHGVDCFRNVPVTQGPLTQVPTVKPGVRAAVPANQATGQSTASSWKTLLFGLSLVLFALNLAGLFRARQSVQVPEPVPASVQAAAPVQAPAPFQTPSEATPPPEGSEASAQQTRTLESGWVTDGMKTRDATLELGLFSGDREGRESAAKELDKVDPNWRARFPTQSREFPINP